jgi:hypothetical protein
VLPTPEEQKVLDRKEREYYDKIGEKGITDLPESYNFMDTWMEGIDDLEKPNIVS